MGKGFYFGALYDVLDESWTPRLILRLIHVLIHEYHVQPDIYVQHMQLYC